MKLGEHTEPSTASLHSNLVIFKFRANALNSDTLSFTFQSGYIQMLQSTLQAPLWSLYIPIWLYSNEGCIINIAIRKTLHSNLVIFKWRHTMPT